MMGRVGSSADSGDSCLANGFLDFCEHQTYDGNYWKKIMAYTIKYRTEENGEIMAYLAEIPTTAAFGANRKEAFRNLIKLLHGPLDIGDQSLNESDSE